MQKSLAKNSIYNIIYTVANILFPFVTSIYVSRILLPVGVGKVVSAQNIACVLGLMLLELPNTIGLIVEVGCGALVYIAINLMMKNALMFEMIQKFKTKLLHKA